MPSDVVQRPRWRSSAWVALAAAACAPVVVAYALAARMAVNVPFIDDYPNLLGFLLQFKALPTMGAKLLYLFTAQHDEYRFVFMHLAALIEQALTHHVNMVVLSLAGDLLLLPLLWILWDMYFAGERSSFRRAILFLPIVFLLFQLNYFEGMDWPSASLDYFAVILFSFAAIHLLVRARDGRISSVFLASCVATCLAGFAAPNAVALAPVALFVVWSRRAYVQGIVWLAAFGAGLSPYAYHYVRHATPGPGSAVFFFEFYLSFLGSGNPSFSVTVAAGAVMLVVFALALWKRFYRTHPSAVLSTTWLLLSGLMVAWGRAHGGFEFSRISRYKIFSDLLLIFGYGFGVTWVEQTAVAASHKRMLYAAALLASVIICARADGKVRGDMRTHRAELLEGLAQYQAAPDTVSPMYFRDGQVEAFFSRQEVEARALMEEATRAGLYVPPAAETSQR